jgi:hypothetical protein
MNRRDFMYGLGGTLGTLAFNSLLAAESPLAPKAGHHKARAKNCIFIFMEGGPSHIDTFDPKPELAKLHMKEFSRQSKFASAMSSGKRYYVASPFEFKTSGKSGIPMCSEYEHLSTVADELCLYRGCQGESVNHPTACYHMNTGNRFGGDPAVGSWVSYGLGTANQDLPSFVVLPELNYPQGGSANWSNGFLPAHYQGTTLRAKGAPILDLLPPKGVTRDLKAMNLDALRSVNARHAAAHPAHDALEARMSSYELAFRMQAIVPDLIDLGKETQKTREAYGIGQSHTEDFGRRCLLARRMVENGVRFVQLYAGGWDSHDYLERAHSARIRSVDKPIAALIRDLRDRGMLDDTLVFCCGEFGRSPDNGVRGGGARVGRDHNAKAMSVWFAGGGVKAGHIVGATDEIGDKAVDVVHPIKDLHVTLLHLLGLDDNRLTYFDQGRFKQLSQTGGQLIPEILG